MKIRLSFRTPYARLLVTQDIAGIVMGDK
jgi:hypothetical protein